MLEDPTVTPTAICEDCWLSAHIKWEPESINEYGTILMRISGIDLPKDQKPRSVEVCGVCGSITISGIYEFRDTNTLLLSDENEDNCYLFDLHEDYSFEDEEDGYEL
jgi:hypothetical protein